MSSYEVLYESHAERDLDGVSGSDFGRIDSRIASLAADPRPHGAKKLFDRTYRIRIGDWRVIYLVDDAEKTVIILRVKRRNEGTYR